MTDNYKSVLGADNLYYALVTQDDASAYSAGAATYLAPLANISIKPKSGMKTQYFDNVAMDVLLSEGESEAEIEIQGLPLDRKAALLGKTLDAATGRMFDDGGTPPYVAIGFRALKSDGSYKYYWYLKCVFSPSDDEAATKADAPDPKSTKMKLTAIFTAYLFNVSGSIYRGVKKVEGDTSLGAFSGTTWFDAVQVPVVGSPSALTCTPVPANDATNQLITAAITLTFNNAISGNSEKGCSLSRLDTKAAIAVTRTIDAARKVVTLAHASLTLDKTYLLSVSGVTDIYGQALADVVFEFATAAA